MKRILVLFLFSHQISHASGKVYPPVEGAYVGAYTDAGGGASDVSVENIKDYEDRVGKKLVWNYFSNNWLGGEILFPQASVEACDRAEVIPYIRLLPWVEMRTSGPDPYYKMKDFAQGVFDEPLRRWAQQAKAYGKPLILEFGPEVNGDWFAWNGRWNGGGKRSGYGDPNVPDGPESFRDAYRQIIEIFRQEEVSNVTWVFHVDTSWSPHSWWNEAAFYYPGDDYIDWIGLSVFGAQLPTHKWYLFENKLDYFWPQLESVSLFKPVMISEFAVIEHRNDQDKKARWLQQSLRSIRMNPKYQRIKAITYWNSPGWLEDGSADFRLTSSPQAERAYREEMSHSFWKGERVQEELGQ